MNGKQQDIAHTPKIKICGITAMEEARWLNEAGADYAGFVFYEKSKRNILIADAVEIKKCLDPSIRTVAVTVSPTVDQLREIETGGFEILQVHKELSLEVLRECKLPVWRAFNVENAADAAEQRLSADEFTEEQKEREQLENQLIEAYVLDGALYGRGKTFDWNSGNAKQIRALFGDKKLVLAGGLNASNVTEGINIFRPDIVDVSSGVEKEYGSGKDEEKIQKFISEVRKNG